MALTFRFAQETDTLLILQFIRELADYEHLLDQVVADEDRIYTLRLPDKINRN